MVLHQYFKKLYDFIKRFDLNIMIKPDKDKDTS